MVYGDEAGFRMLTEKITRDRGFRCASYKDKCLRRRIAVRMRAKATTSPAEYATILDDDPREYDRLMKSLTVNVTKFFRNWDTYSVIDKKVIPALWERSDEELRVWSAGCASGEEPYSLGILMHRHASETRSTSRLENVSILGTDIDGECLGEAERALYAESALGDTPASLRDGYFPLTAGQPAPAEHDSAGSASSGALRGQRFVKLSATDRERAPAALPKRHHLLRAGSSGCAVRPIP